MVAPLQCCEISVTLRKKGDVRSLIWQTSKFRASNQMRSTHTTFCHSSMRLLNGALRGGPRLERGRQTPLNALPSR